MKNPTNSKRIPTRVGILTGGGDAPGLNGVLEAACKTLLAAHIEVVGIFDGFQGVYEERTRLITAEDLVGLHGQAGTFLGTTNRFGTQGRESEFLKHYNNLHLDGLIAVGGDGTFRGLEPFKNQVSLIGVPKTIDNDISGTEATFGYDTACSVVAEAVDALRATANAHRRAIVVETMGRTAGWIALGGGMASYADVILVPERPFNLDQLMLFIKERMTHQRGVIVVVAEGAHAVGEAVAVSRRVVGAPEEVRLGGVAERLALQIEQATGLESRHVVLGHLQRARAPTTTDRFLTLAMGVKAAELVISKNWGMATVYRGGQVTSAPITDCMGPVRLISAQDRWVKSAQAVGIFL